MVEQNRHVLLQGHVLAAFDAATRGDMVVAIDHCRTVLDGSQDEALRRDAMRLLACLYAMSGECQNLLLLLGSGDAAVLAEDEFESNLRLVSDLGHPEEAIRNESLRISSVSR